MLSRSRVRLAEARQRLERHDSLDPLRARLVELGNREIHLVEWAWRGTLRPGVRRTAVLISWLGNGLAYLALAAVLLLAVSGMCVLVAHLIYPWTKLACGRQRPCELRSDLEPRLASLDKHSFPSGHAMTLTAALLPILIAYPAIWPVAAIAWLLMAWSRVACAHHYPSDVLAGSALGLVVAAPLSWLLV
jgi:undecaprenyl-diphosphatase